MSELAADVLAALSTPDEVESRLGRLEVTDGAGSILDTAAELYGNMHDPVYRTRAVTWYGRPDAGRRSGPPSARIDRPHATRIHGEAGRQFFALDACRSSSCRVGDIGNDRSPSWIQETWVPRVRPRLLGSDGPRRPSLRPPS